MEPSIVQDKYRGHFLPCVVAMIDIKVRNITDVYSNGFKYRVDEETLVKWVKSEQF